MEEVTENVSPIEVTTNPNFVDAVKEFEQSFRDRSFSGRHPELGKMIKCDGCGRRHRSSIIHERVFAKDENGNPRIAQMPRRLRVPANPYGWKPKSNPLILLLVHKARQQYLAGQAAKDVGVES